jgi:hypothetical protein
MDWGRFWPWFGEVIGGFAIGVFFATLIERQTAGSGPVMTYAFPFGAAALLVSCLIRMWLRSKRPE